MKKRTRFLSFIFAITMFSSIAALHGCNADSKQTFSAENSVSEEIDSPDDETGSSSESSAEPETPPQPIIKYTSYFRCTGENVNIRSGAGTNFSTLGQAEKGTMYVLIEKIGNWYKTYYKNKVAYIYAEYASVFSLKQSDDTTVETVLNEGYKLIGVPYVYGAVRLHDGKGNLLSSFTAQKFDCSSLVQYVFYKGANTLLQVTTRTQVKQGVFVPKSELKRGDCIYFTNAERQHKTGVERVGHVAIYLGDNYILHTSSDYARIEKMNSTRWGYYIEARRFT